MLRVFASTSFPYRNFEALLREFWIWFPPGMCEAINRCAMSTVVTNATMCSQQFAAICSQLRGRTPTNCITYMVLKLSLTQAILLHRVRRCTRIFRLHQIPKNAQRVESFESCWHSNIRKSGKCMPCQWSKAGRYVRSAPFPELDKNFLQVHLDMVLLVRSHRRKIFTIAFNACLIRSPPHTSPVYVSASTAFFTNWISCYGAPAIVTMDQGT